MATQEQQILKVFSSETYLYVVKKQLIFRENSRKLFTSSYILGLQDVGCYGKHLFLYIFSS